MSNGELRLVKMSETDFDTLISWIKAESELIQFAGSIFSYPLTKEQLRNYLTDTQRHAFKVIHNDTNKTIGHCEAYQTDEQNCRLCRILIGDKKYRGSGYGTLLTKRLAEWVFDNLQVNFIDLNVYSFNTSAIKAYENVGFRITATNERTIQVNNESWESYRMTIDREIFYPKSTT